MPDPEIALEGGEGRFVEDLGDETELLVDEDVLAVGDRDAGGFLAAVLLGEQSEVGEPCDFLPRRPHAEETALLFRALRSHDPSDANTGSGELRVRRIAGPGVSGSMTRCPRRPTDASRQSCSIFTTPSPSSPPSCGGARRSPSGRERTPSCCARRGWRRSPSAGSGSSARSRPTSRWCWRWRACSPTTRCLADLAATEYERWARGVRAFDDSLPCLERLRAGGYRLALVSNCSRQTRDVVPALGLDRAMDAIVLSYEVGVRKPGERIFRDAMAALGVEPERTLFVDDIVEYLDGAASLGIRTVRIDRGHAIDTSMQPDTLIGDPGARHPAIASLAELDAFLS